MAVPSPSSTSKEALRAAALEARRDYARSLTPDLRKRLEAQLVEIVLPHLIPHASAPAKAGAQSHQTAALGSGLRRSTEASPAVIGGYYPMRDEISPLPLLDALQEHGRITALPWFANRDARMMFRETPAVETGPWRVMQPSPHAPPVLPNLVLVPLVLADRAGTRIGHGKGHYDRALAHLRESGPVRTIGIAWDVQISEEPIQPDPWDVPLDAIATPTTWIDCR